MLEPLAAMGLAGNIIQLVQFSVQLVEKAREIRQRGYLGTGIEIRMMTKSTLKQLERIRELLVEDGKEDTAQAEEDKVGFASSL